MKIVVYNNQQEWYEPILYTAIIMVINKDGNAMIPYTDYDILV